MVFLIFNFHDESHRRGTDRSRGGIWNIGPQNRQTLVNPLNPYFGTLIKFTSHPIFTSSDSTSRKKIPKGTFLRIRSESMLGFCFQNAFMDARHALSRC